LAYGCIESVSPHRDTVSIQDSQSSFVIQWASRVPRAVNRAYANKNPTFSNCLAEQPKPARVVRHTRQR
jgi:GAF domain-containing protein